jgi:hypothetical protein
MGSDVTLWLFGAYVCLHVGVYLALLPVALSNERGVLLYHLASFGLCGVLSLIGAVVSGTDLAWATATSVLALHGIYSLSFLEIWSLTRGNHALSIISALSHMPGTAAPGDITVLEQIGGEQETSRLAQLERIDLVNRRDGHLELTQRGRVVATVLWALRRWSSPTETR